MIWWIIGGLWTVIALACIGAGAWLTYRKRLESSE